MENEEQQVEQEEEIQPSEVNHAEEEAMAMGWQPEEDFKADPKNEGKKWRSAEEFLDRKPLFDKIDDLSRRLKNNEKALQSLSAQSLRAEKIGYDKALQDLKVAKKEALEEGNADRVIEIDEKIVDLKQARQNEPAVPAQAPQEFLDWVDRNDWYRTNPKLKAAADGIGIEYIKQGLPPAEVLKRVEQDMRDFMPVKPRPKAPQSPESGARKTNGSGSGPESVKSKMTGEELRIMKTIVNTGLKEDEYLKQFVETQPERFKGVKL